MLTPLHKTQEERGNKNDHGINGNQRKHFISNMHPVRTLDMTDSNLIKHAYKTRVKNLENSIGGFVVNIVFKKDMNSFIKTYTVDYFLSNNNKA